MASKAKITNNSNCIIALVSCPYSYDSYVRREDMAIDDLGLGALYSALTALGYQVVLFDSQFSSSSFIPALQQLLNQLLQIQPKYIGFSDPIINFEKSLQLSRELKQHLPDSIIIYGDIHASMYNVEILKHEPQVDFVMVGEADRSLPQLINALEANEDVSQIAGLSFRENGEIVSIPPDLTIDLNTLPLPYRPSLDKPEANKDKYFNLISSRGCPGHCTYCSMSAFNTRYLKGKTSRWRARSPEHIFAEIEFLFEKGVRKFFFYDDNWIGHQEEGLERVSNLCDLIINKLPGKISISAAIRPDSLTPENADLFPIMKKAGLNILSIGLEAGHPYQQKLFAKRFQKDQVRDLVNLIFDNKIMVRCGFIMFFPYSTFDMLRENASFLKQLGLSYLLSSFYSRLTALSSIPIEKKLINDGLVEAPTTYRFPGRYKYRDKRINNLLRYIAAAMFPQQDLIYDLIFIGGEMSRISTGERDLFGQFRCLLSRVSESTNIFFSECLDVFEANEDETRAIKLCSNRLSAWSEELSQIKTDLVRFSEPVDYDLNLTA